MVEDGRKDGTDGDAEGLSLCCFDGDIDCGTRGGG